jgi:two-component system chemotaxis sensor kinase CheA
MEEAHDILAQLGSGRDDAPRLIHTLKGNCGVLGVFSVAEHCNDLETRLAAAQRLPNAEEITALRAAWDNFASRVAGVLDVQTHTIAVSSDDVRSIREAVRTRAPYPAIDRMLRELAYEPAAHALDRLAAKARTLAQRLNKGEVEVHLQSDPVRLDPKRWRGFWASFIHAVRNAIDHGIEQPHEREACGKPRAGRLHLAVRAGADSTIIEFGDDGRGIDWHRVKERASERGLPCDTRDELVQALFVDGVSTRTEVSDYSGRGVGMGALAEATHALGGRIEVESASGDGTRLRIEIPQPRLLSVIPPAA